MKAITRALSVAHRQKSSIKGLIAYKISVEQMTCKKTSDSQVAEARFCLTYERFQTFKLDQYTLCFLAKRFGKIVARVFWANQCKQINNSEDGPQRQPRD